MDEYPLSRAPSPSIGGMALVVGAIAFAAGFLGSFLLYPDSNLAPLLGIFITGPVGFLAGALFGIVRSSRGGQQDAARRELIWLAAMWLFSLLYTFIFAWGWTWVGPILQTAVVATAACIFHGKGMRPLPRSFVPFRVPLLAAGLFSLLASVFPPIVARDEGRRFAFILDGRFDARYNVPEFSIDSSALVLEWLFFIAVALAIGFTTLAADKLRTS